MEAEKGVIKMIIMGIDPGIAITGYGIIEYDGNQLKPIDYGYIQTLSYEVSSIRLKAIYEGISGLIKTFQPNVFVIEELFFNKNIRTALTVGQARGVAILAAGMSEIAVYEYTPLQVKQSVIGYGRAKKEQVQFMVKELLNLKEIPKPDDVADALAIAICHCNWHKLADQIKYQKSRKDRGK